MFSFQNRNKYEVMVIGLGAMGSATLYQTALLLTGSNKKVLGIDQYDLSHAQGSSHGESRITRLATCEGEEYVALAKRTLEIFKQLGQETKTELYTATGGLIIGQQDEKDGFLQKTMAVATAHKINHRELTAAKIAKKFPQLKVQSSAHGYYEPTMGILDPEKCINTQLQLVRQHGAEIHTKEKLLSFTRGPQGVIRVKTDRNEYVTEKLVIATGPWLPQTLNIKNLTVHRSMLYWFEIKPSLLEKYKKGNFPAFIWDLGQGNAVIGFPAIKDNCLKVALFPTGEKGGVAVTPENVNRSVSAEEQQETYQKYIQPYFHGIINRCVKTAVCLYTAAPGNKFVIDYLSDFGKRIMFVSACSGHGFKHSAAIGEAVAQQLILGKCDINILEMFGSAMPVVSNTSPQSKL